MIRCFLVIVISLLFVTQAFADMSALPSDSTPSVPVSPDRIDVVCESEEEGVDIRFEYEVSEHAKLLQSVTLKGDISFAGTKSMISGRFGMAEERSFNSMVLGRGTIFGMLDTWGWPVKGNVSGLGEEGEDCPLVFLMSYSSRNSYVAERSTKIAVGHGCQREWLAEDPLDGFNYHVLTCKGEIQ